jgi:subtilisin family serine protease
MVNYRTSRLYFAFRLSFTFLVLSVAAPAFPAVSEEILIRLRGSDAATMARAQNAAPFGTIRPLSPSLGLHLVRAPGNSVSGLLRAFSNHPDVLYAEPNYIVRAVTTNPNDSFFSSLWGMQQIGAPSAWDVSTGGTSPVVGVVDTGIDYTHPDLAENVWSAPTAFSVTIDGFTVNCPAGSHGFNAINLTCDPRDNNDHGTHVSGTIGATGNNSLGVVGVTWRTRMMGLKFLGANGMGSIDAAINAMEFAIQVKARFAGTATPVDVRVLSNSWSTAGFSQSLLDEINRSNANDMLFVAAAGNISANNDQSPSYPANFSTIAPNVISVAATDGGDGLAGFSNYGAATVQLSAPGVGIYSTVRNGQYTGLDGTSMATPHVAGAALLTLSACPSLNTAALKAAILANVDPVSSLAGLTVTGGRLNINRTIRSCIPPTAGSLKATFLGTDQDRVGPAQLAPSGTADWRMKLEGLRSTPVRIRISSTVGGVWESPFNGLNWLILPQYDGAGNADLWFEPWSTPSFHVKVWYADASTDEIDAVAGAPPTGLKATFLGSTGADHVGPGQIAPSGVADWRIQLQGLRSIPVTVRISSLVGGVWESPFNGINWLILPQYDGAGNADVWFEPWSAPNFHVKVWYSDGSTDEVDATSPGPPTFAVRFLGFTGEDLVGPASVSPSGTSDWRMKLEGLRSTPVRIRISSTVGGVWESPFNGTNWLILPQYDGAGNADLWFEPWSLPGFHVTVWYSDGTTDEADGS